MKKKVIFGIALGAFFLWLAVRNVSLSEVVKEIGQVKWLYLIAAFLIAIVTHFFRAARWGIILGGIKKVNYWSLFSINAVGFLFIHIIPLRLGEFVKPYLLKQKHGIRMSSGFATVAVERVFDGLTLVFLLVISFIFANFQTDKIPHVGQRINYLILIGVLIFGCAFVFLMLLVFSRNFALKIISKVASILPSKFQSKINEMAHAFVEGLSSLPNVKKQVLIGFYSFAIWLLAAGIMYLNLLAFDLKLPWEASFVALGIVSLGIMLPGPPGFVGNFQLFCQGALGLYGVSAVQGLSYSIVVHFVNILAVFTLGFICLPGNMVSYKAAIKAGSLGKDDSNSIGEKNPESLSL